MRKKTNLSSNYSKKSRPKSMIKFVIFHYTGMQSEIESIYRLKNPKSKVSCHFLINLKGEVIQMVKENKVAWHAGKSKWKKYTNLNNHSIGIELVNKGHRFGYRSFPKRQIKSLISLCKTLKSSYKIRTENFLGHSDIAPLRKVDPGEKFPWKNLSKFQFGYWHKIGKNSLNYSKDKAVFFKNLYKIGYRYFKINKRTGADRRVIRAFQQRYYPQNVTGNLDQKTYEISHYLANINKKT